MWTRRVDPRPHPHPDQVIEQANAPILGVDTEGRINEWNRKAAQITGFEKTEVTAGRNCPMGVDRVLIGC